MFDINFNDHIAGVSENDWIWKLIPPVVGASLGSFFGFISGNKLAIRREKESDKRFLAYVLQTVETCGRNSISLVDSLKSFVSNIEKETTNGPRIPSPAIFSRFTDLDHSRVYDVLVRKDLLTDKSKKSPNKDPGDVYKLITSINFIPDVLLAIIELIQQSNVHIVKLETEFQNEMRTLNNILRPVQDFDKFLLQSGKAAFLKKPDDSTFVRLTNKEYHDSFIPLVSNYMKNRVIDAHIRKQMENAIHRMRELFANIIGQNESLVGSKGGVLDRVGQIQSSADRIKQFVEMNFQTTLANNLDPIKKGEFMENGTVDSVKGV